MQPCRKTRLYKSTAELQCPYWCTTGNTSFSTCLASWRQSHTDVDLSNIAQVVFSPSNMRCAGKYFERAYTWPEPDDPATCPLWFIRRSMDTWYSNPRFSLDWQESRDLYTSLIQDQEQIVASNVDIDTFKYGLERFPALKRVAITPSAYGMDHEPFFRTPMFRAFPAAFEYPRRNAWPQASMDALPWIGKGGPSDPYEQIESLVLDSYVYILVPYWLVVI